MLLVPDRLEAHKAKPIKSKLKTNLGEHVREHAKSCADHCTGARPDNVSTVQIIVNGLLR